MVRMNTNGGAQESTLIPRMDEQTRLLFAQRVKVARIEQGKTQGEVASAAGIARNTLAAMENGTGVPQSEKLWKVMLVLGIRPDREEPEWLQEWWRIISPLAQKLPEETRGEVMGRIVRTLYESLGE